MRALLIAVFAFTLASAAHAQEIYKPFIRTSIVAGLGASQIDGDEIAGYTKPGIIAGIAARVALTDKLGLQEEVLFVQKGSRSTENQLPIFVRWRTNYLEVPVMLAYDILPKFSLLGGGAVGYLISAKLDEGGGYQDQSARFKTLDFMYVAGLEYQISDGMALNMRLEYSLTPVTKQAPSFYNNTIAVSLRFFAY